ncbi:MAG: galactitol-1-phosphate 5-dehydrogenase [Lachnospiraceae bacterium]|nr:galactitol-1-phosphate 5-dehydrogenase [Lachnospiraceae bacterium]
MKAWVLHGIGDIRFETVDNPVPGEGEVLVQVKAAGICGSDIPRLYQNGAYSHPLIPGHEFAGIVAETGTGVDKGLLGQRVGVFPLIPCGTCLPCRRGHFEMCRNYSYTGSRRDGAFAEYVTVPVRNLICLPQEVSFEEAAMLEPMSVAVHAMRRVHPQKEEKIVICGLGTIGLLLLSFLLEAGAGRILVVGNKDFQRQMVQRSGLSEHAFYDSRQGNAAEWILEQTEGNGADVFFECAGKNETCTLAVESAAPLGRVLLVGNPFTDMILPKDIYWKILRNQLTVSGSWNSSFLQKPEDDWHYALHRLTGKQIAPSKLITHRIPLAHLDQGLHIMKNKTEDNGKIMVYNGQERSLR